MLGSIVNGHFLLRLNPNSVPVAVSPEFWVFSLFYSLATFGGTFLALSLLYLAHRPSWSRSVLDLVVVSGSAAILLLAVLQAWPALSAWAAV